MTSGIITKGKAMLLAVATTLGLGAGSALAHPPGITEGEAARLRYQHQQLQHLRRAAWADGEITRREHARISYQAAKLRRLVHIARNN